MCLIRWLEKYTAKSVSRRWPIQVFFNIFDMAAINAWIICKETTGINIKRRDFIFNITEKVCTNCYL